MSPQRSEIDYVLHNIVPAFAQYRYPQAGDSINLRVCSVRIPMGSSIRHPDLVYYANKVPLLVVENKKEGESMDYAKGEAFSYTKNFPLSGEFNQNSIRPKYFATTDGPRIHKFYRYHYEINETGELIEDIENLENVLTYEQLKELYGLETIKPRIDREKFKELFYELASIYITTDKKKLTPEIIKMVVIQLYEFLKDQNNYVSRQPYISLDRYHDRQLLIRNMFSQYDWVGSLGSELAGEFKDQILRSFQGAGLNQYITPKSVVDLMLNLVEIQDDKSVLDFECGSGSFIRAAVSQEVSMDNVFGVDIADLPYFVSKTYLALYFKITGERVDSVPIILGNGLFDLEGQWDVVIGNPAGGSKYDPENELNDLEDVLENLEDDLDQNGRSDSLSEYNFSIQQAVRSCKLGGKICLVLPEGFFANSTDEVLRKYVSKYCKVKAVVSLPRGVFRKGTTTRTVNSGSTSANQKMSILLVEKTKEVEEGAGVDIDLKEQIYPVFLASVEKPEEAETDIDGWLEPLLAEVLNEWESWQKTHILLESDTTINVPVKRQIIIRKSTQQKLFKAEAPLFETGNEVSRKPKTKKKTLIPRVLEKLFSEGE